MDPLDLLSQGRIFEAVNAAFLNLMGSYYYLFLVGMVYVAIYFKTRSIAIPSILALFSGFLFVVILPPETHTIIYFLVAIGVAGLLYRAYAGRNPYG